MNRDEIRNEIEKIRTAPQIALYPDTRTAPATLLLTEAVLNLDKTSGRLAGINIGLGVVLAVLTIVQIYLTIRH